MQDVSHPDASDAEWQKLAPLLDQMIGELSDRDRDAVVLRYIEARPFREIGATLRLTEDAARMRADRALEKLRGALKRRGIASTSAALGLALANQSAAAVPAGVTVSITGAALTGAAAASGAGGVWLAFFTMSKIEIGVGAAIVAAIIVTGARDVRANRDLRAELAAATAQQEELSWLQTEKQQLSAGLAKATGQNPDAIEIARLQARAEQLKARPPWVREANVKWVTRAREAGWTTADAALETFIWARANGGRTTLINNFAWVGEAKAQAEAEFAKLNETLRAKYGSADKFAGAVLFSGEERGLGDYKWTRDGMLETAAANPGDPIVAYWAGSDPEARFPKLGNMERVRGWVRTASGAEHPITVDLTYAGGSWTTGTSVFSTEAWQQMVARVDPVTGAISAPRH